MSIALNGTFIEKMNESIKFAETNRSRVQFIYKQLQDSALRQEILRREQQGLGSPTQATIDTIADAWAGENAKFKVAVSNEQWGSRLATMYALAELVVAQREANDIARQQLNATRDANALQAAVLSRLNEMISLLDVRAASSNDNTNVTVPQPRSGT